MSKNDKDITCRTCNKYPYLASWDKSKMIGCFCARTDDFICSDHQDWDKKKNRRTIAHKYKEELEFEMAAEHFVSDDSDLYKLYQEEWERVG